MKFKDIIINAFHVKELRKKLFMTLLLIIIFRIGCFIPVPGRRDDAFNELANNGMFKLYDMLSGGAFQQVSLFAMTISPYINASIIVQLLTVAIPVFERWQKEGPEGRKKLSKVTKIITLVLALFQSIMMYFNIQGATHNIFASQGEFDIFTFLIVILSFTAGTSVLMWLGEKITETGIGNGISMIIFAGIIMEIPYQIGQAYNNFVGVDATDGSAIFNGIIQFCIYLLGYIGIVLFVMFIEKAERRIPMQHAQTSFQVRTNDVSYLPIKLNSAGVIPVIFASSLLTVPPIIMNFAGVSQSNPLYRILSLNTEDEGFYWGTCIYIFLIFVFTFFYTSLQLDAEKMATNFAKSGTYIPGVRPGKETKQYISSVIGRITLIGSFFIALVAGLPIIFSSFINTGLPASVSIGGTSILIVIGVALETYNQLESSLINRNYKGGK